MNAGIFDVGFPTSNCEAKAQTLYFLFDDDGAYSWGFFTFVVQCCNRGSNG